MSRDGFLMELQYFDENFNSIVHKKENTPKPIIGGGLGSYTYNGLHGHTPYSNSYNRIDMAKIRQLTLSNENCFEPLYDLDVILLYPFFAHLSYVEWGIVYFSDFAEKYRDQREKDRNGALQNKIDSVIEYANLIGMQNTTLKDLDRLKKSLRQHHFTKRQLFEHLLFIVASVLNNGKQSRKVASFTNKIIKDYFNNDEITFSRETNIDRFTLHTYSYISKEQVLNLVHS